MKNKRIKSKCKNMRICEYVKNLSTTRLNDFTTSRWNSHTVLQSCSPKVMQSIFSFLVIFLLSSDLLSAQEWTVPASKAKALSPFSFTDETRKEGETLYTDKCKACHGDPGRGNVLMTVPAPPDLATKKMQRNTDGELHFKISEGHTVMLPFKNTLSETEIWQIVSYIRSFNDDYKQQVAPKEEEAACKTTVPLENGKRSKKRKR